MSRGSFYKFLEEQTIDNQDPWEWAKDYYAQSIKEALNPLFADSLRVVRQHLTEGNLDAAKFTLEKFGHIIKLDNKQIIDTGGNVTYIVPEQFLPKGDQD